MKRFALALVLVAALPSIAVTRAQQSTVYTIHGHPQKASYASASEWPLFDTQCHWQQTATNHLLGHVHIGLQAPFYAEIAGPLTVPFTMKLFQIQGSIMFVTGLHVTSVVFDGPATDTVTDPVTKAMTTLSTVQGTGTSTPPILNGDPRPGGLVTEQGHLTLDPTVDMGWGTWPAHGWYADGVTSYVMLSDGTRLDSTGFWSFYSVLDPSQPEVQEPGENGILTGAHCVQRPAVGDELGEAVSGITSFAPLAPIGALWPISYASYTYGVSPAGGGASGPPQLAQGFTEFSLDANLHMGVQGTQIFQFRSPDGTPPDNGTAFGPNFGLPSYQLDPAVLGAGSHTMLMRWQQPTGSGCVQAGDGTGVTCSVGTDHFPAGETSWALVQFPVTVGSAPPPPPNPCVTDPLHFTSAQFPLLTALSSGWTYIVDHVLASISATPTSITAADTRGCTATASSGS